MTDLARHMAELREQTEKGTRTIQKAIESAGEQIGGDNPGDGFAAVGRLVQGAADGVRQWVDAAADHIGPGLGEDMQEQLGGSSTVGQMAAGVVSEGAEGVVEITIELGAGAARAAVIEPTKAVGDIVANTGEALNHLGREEQSPVEGGGEAIGVGLTGVVAPLADLAKGMTVDLFETAANVYGESVEAGLEVAYQLVEPIVEPADRTVNTEGPAAGDSDSEAAARSNAQSTSADTPASQDHGSGNSTQWTIACSDAVSGVSPCDVQDQASEPIAWSEPGSDSTQSNACLPESDASASDASSSYEEHSPPAPPPEPSTADEACESAGAY